MLAGEYILKNLKAFQRMAAAGLVSYKMLYYAEVNEWHVKNGCRLSQTCEHFSLSQSTVIYINQRMSQRIMADDLQ
ncbi:MAG: hypothetical protein KBS77_07340 [Bacteroidales bacterium]|nr:hypothetical protein [Candidatus Colicola faecequi]